MAHVADGPLILVETSRIQQVAATVVTQVLGRIEANAQVNGDPASNNTRWIVDVESLAGVDVELYLLEYRSGRRLDPDLMSFSITPLDPDCYDARPYAVPGRGRLTVRTREIEPASVIHYRVAIDVMHSATR